jgi:hypothetical protein
MPVPRTWITEQKVLPGPQRGTFREQATGRVADQSAQQVIEDALSLNRSLDRGGPIRKALALYLRSRHNPAEADKAPWLPMAPEYAEHRNVIDPLLALPLWGQISVLASPLFLVEPRDPIGTAADVLLLNSETGSLAIGMLHTRPTHSIPEPAVIAELGAAIRMFGDAFNTTQPEKGCAIWAAPNKTELTWHPAEDCVVAWADVLDIHRYRQRELAEVQ